MIHPSMKYQLRMKMSYEYEHGLQLFVKKYGPDILTPLSHEYIHMYRYRTEMPRLQVDIIL